MKLEKALTLSHVMTLALCVVLAGACAYAADPAAAVETAHTAIENGEKAAETGFSMSAKYAAIAVIMAIGSLAASMAVGKIGAAAMGAATEKPELLGKAIAYVGLGEGIALFGFLISLFLLVL